MKKYILLILFVLLNIFLYKSLSVRVFPHTHLGRLDISGRTKKNVESLLVDNLQKPLYIRIKNRVYEYRYSDLGIVLNIHSQLDTTFEPNELPFPKNIAAFIRSYQSNKFLLPTLEFTEDYYHFVRDSVFDFTDKADEIAVDDTKKQLIYRQNEEKYTIDPNSLKSQIIHSFGKEKTILTPGLSHMESVQKEKVLGKNTALSQTFDEPVRILLESNQDIRFTLPADQLKQLINLSYKPDEDQVAMTFNEESFQTLIKNVSSHLNLTADQSIATADLKQDLISLIQTRSQGNPSDAVLAKIQFIPNSSGSLAQKYIEVDISQQTMYLFEGGNIARSYKISTGLQYPTPVGNFKILNKATNAFSDIYSVWMPFWMAFHYAADVNAYLGIHELPYWVAEGGQKIHRPSEFIGSPHTGGCIALDIGAAKEVYAFSEVDMPVYVYN